jgi:hypothetical protein
MKAMKQFLKLLLTTSIIGMIFLSSCTIDSVERYPVIEYIEETSTGYVEGELIVNVDSSVSDAEIDALVPGIRVKTITSFDTSRYILYRVFNKQDIETTMIALMASGRVIHVEKNAVYSLCQYIPDDPYYSSCQYAPRITGCEDAWELVETPGSDIIVAVLDTGINGEHEDLEGRVIAGKNILTGEYIPPSVNSDDNGHGSHVAGIIGAKGDNGKGIAGVAWYVRLMPVKIFGGDIFTTTAHIAEAIVWAVDHGAHVVNMSLVGMLYSTAVNDAVNYALQHNVVLVAAMGNDFKTKIEYPGAHPGVIAVGATNGRDQVSYFSTRGTHISVAAPGEGIYSLKNTSNTEYVFGSGTSMATPFVSGLAALLLSANANLTPEEVRSIIEDSADHLGEADFNSEYGHGRVNVYNALNLPVRNNYGSVTVNVTNKGAPIGGIKVLLQDNTSSIIIQSGITSYGGIDGGENGKIVFNHVRPGNYTVRVQVGIPQEADIILTPEYRAQEASFTFDTPVVLVVNAIKKADSSLLTDEFLYAKKLTALGKHFTLWKTAYHGPPTKELINAYDLMIWYTGRTQNEPSKNIEILNEQEVTVLKDYLDSGGRLYLCGNNIAQHLRRVNLSFLNDYLHADYITSPLSHDDIYGKGFLEGMEISISMGDDDQIDLGPGAVGILDSSDEEDENHWAGLCWDTDYRLVFTTIYPNQIVSCLPNIFLETIIAWLETDS